MKAGVVKWLVGLQVSNWRKDWCPAMRNVLRLSVSKQETEIACPCQRTCNQVSHRVSAAAVLCDKKEKWWTGRNCVGAQFGWVNDFNAAGKFTLPCSLFGPIAMKLCASVALGIRNTQWGMQNVLWAQLSRCLISPCLDNIFTIVSCKMQCYQRDIPDFPISVLVHCYPVA